MIYTAVRDAILGLSSVLYLYCIRVYDIRLFACRALVRRSTSLQFPACGRSVLVGDKSGDVVCYSLLSDSEGQVLMGHVSMLLDMVRHRYHNRGVS